MRTCTCVCVCPCVGLFVCVSLVVQQRPLLATGRHYTVTHLPQFSIRFNSDLSDLSDLWSS